MNTSNLTKTAVVTGASSGIGAAAAAALAAQGWRLIVLGRSAPRMAAAVAAIRAQTPGVVIDTVLADVSVLAEVARAAREIAARTDHIDVLVNNAGGTRDKRYLTVDGFEAILAANYLGPALLTLQLLPLLRAAKAGHVINVASAAHGMIKDMFWDDLQLANHFSQFKAYGQSKLALVLFTRELARREAAHGVRVNAMHPGLVASNLASSADLITRIIFVVAKPFALRPTQGADTIVWLATDAQAATHTGGYFIKRKRLEPSAAARNEASAARLWELSQQLFAKTLVATA